MHKMRDKKYVNFLSSSGFTTRGTIKDVDHGELCVFLVIPSPSRPDPGDLRSIGDASIGHLWIMSRLCLVAKRSKH